jgi:alanine racemase
MPVTCTSSWHRFSFPLRHAASSAAAVCHPESRLDMVRCGLAVYGLYPSAGCRRALDLRPAMSLKSRISRLRWLPEGSSVSYGRTYRTSRPTLVAFVPIGYADGLRRALSSRGGMLVRGQRVPLIGRVCMDGCMADVTAVDGVQEGDEVVLLGRQGQAEITADDIAESVGTISYEVATTVGPRVPRVYLHDDQRSD